MSKCKKSENDDVFPPFIRPYYNPHLIIERAKGTLVYDESGKAYLDCYAGVATVALGHCNDIVDEAAKSQIGCFGHISALYQSNIQINYAKKLVDACDNQLKQLFLVNSGSEAVDLAISLARVSGKSQKVVALSDGYHGGTYLSKSATGLKTWHFDSPPAPDISYVSTPFCHETAKKSLTETKEKFEAIKKEGGQPIFILEPVQGVGGIVIPPQAYFEGLNDLLKKYGGLLLLDEVQTGMGRCGGSLFAFRKFGLSPDLLMLGKGIANGYPLGAVLMTEEVAGANNALLHFNTFGGHPVSVAAATVTLDAINKPEFLKGITEKGARFRDKLTQTLDVIDSVQEIRGIGYMTGIVLTDAEIAANALNACFNKGLLIGMGGRDKNILRLQPALTFTDKEYEQVIEIVFKVLSKSARL
jgi:4-aminobutyrate aminotransferase-like enzyme